MRRAEEWARRSVTLESRHSRTGKRGIRWVASIRVGDLLFEHEAFGDLRRGEALRHRATEAVIQDYLDWVANVLESGGVEALPELDA